MKDSNRSGYLGRAVAASDVRKEYWFKLFSGEIGPLQAPVAVFLHFQYNFHLLP
jgi:hypothetical protein